MTKLTEAVSIRPMTKMHEQMLTVIMAIANLRMEISLR